MGPNANGYLSNELKVSASEFVTRQLGMLRELLTNYGTDYVGRLWWCGPVLLPCLLRAASLCCKSVKPLRQAHVPGFLTGACRTSAPGPLNWHCRPPVDVCSEVTP